MENTINKNEIIWLDANATYVYPMLKDYMINNEELGMVYLSMGSLRFDEKYFLGVKRTNNPNIPLELILYIQYKINDNELKLNYIEIAEKYRGQGLTTLLINNFVNKVVTNKSIPTVITKISSDGQKANLFGKFSDVLTGEITESNKRDIIR